MIFGHFRTFEAGLVKFVVYANLDEEFRLKTSRTAFGHGLGNA
jgi:hypothetical protein